MKLLMKRNLFCSLIVAAAVLCGLTSRAQSQDQSGTPPYKNSKFAVEQRVEDLLSRMTLEEKVEMLSGTGFESKPNTRLGIPLSKWQTARRA